MVVVYFDVETNLYFKNDEFGNKIKFEDVLEIAMIKVENGVILDKFHRYYYPNKEAKFNPMTSRIHGLYENDILENRKEHFREMKTLGFENPFYPKNFESDKYALEKFLKNCDELVAHNLKFDIKFIPEDLIEKYNILSRCTMNDNKDRVKALDKNGRVKFPKLEELANNLGVKFNKDEAHSGIYDVRILMECDLIVEKEKSKDNIQMTFDFN